MAVISEYFDIDTFESKWENAGDKQRVHIIQKSRYLMPSTGIIPILAGLYSENTQIRNYAAANLDFLVKKIGTLLADKKKPDQYALGIKESVLVSARIYSRISSRTSEKDMGFFLKILLEMGGKGPLFAFKALYNGFFDLGSMEKKLLAMSETGRIAFVDQYIQARPSVRLAHAAGFKTILLSIQSRSAMVDFYAGLFDRNRDADPFLLNSHPSMKNPKSIMETELVSKDPAKKVQGLKALSMLMDKIPSNILLACLHPKERPEVHVTIYKIIENSSMGIYSDFFDSIFNLFPRLKGDEIQHAFKALIATDRLPLYQLMEKVCKIHPDLLSVITDEISSMSKTAFFFIQDIALNSEQYRKGIHLEINCACVFGMIKKRPERVVGIFQQAAKTSGHMFKTQAVKFIKKTKQLLTDEKKDIESGFLKTISSLPDKGQKKENKSLFRKKTKSPIENKLTTLKRNLPFASLDFKGENISALYLSGKDYRSATIFFNKSRIEKCDLSETCFSFSFFKSCLIYNVNMQDAVFDSVSFDNAVLINVDAQRAVFKNCSFQGASIYNSNFNDAIIHDAIFVDAVISKSVFENTDLSCSCFAYSQICRVSFSTAIINQVDFSGVKARFSRFPHSNRLVSRTEDIDYNARKYQLTFKDLPQLNPLILTEINRLLFCEFTHYGELKFLKQNKLSLLTAYDIFHSKQADLFRIIPILIHKNMDFPLVDALDNQTPQGICDYLPTRESLLTCAAYMDNADLIIKRDPHPAILGLYTIGSIGSIAQTAESDIDYWVCIQESGMAPSQLKLLEKKLTLLEKMAMDHFDTQVTFFIVDVTRVKENDFGDSTTESSGSAQAGLLKEEFYRTMIYLAGRIPLWCVLPTPVSFNHYTGISSKISTNAPQDRYIDLGDIHEISPEEYFGASIWQMFKWLKSPFKSVIKMALLEKYIFESGQKLLLCNQYKNEWMNTGSHLKLAQNDSYYFLMKHLVGYYKKIGDTHSVNLLLTCFFLKLGVSKKSQLTNTAFGLKRSLLLKCMDTWSWDLTRVMEVGSFKEWPYKKIVRLSLALETYILQKYKKAKTPFENDNPQGSMISKEDKTILEHKVKIEFSDQPMKVKKILLVSRGDQHFSGLYLNFVNTKSVNGEWILLNKGSHGDKNQVLLRAQTIEKIGAWLIINGLFSKGMRIDMTPNPCHVTFNEIQNLYQAIHDFLSPLLKSSVGADQLLVYPQKKAVFVSVNFYAPQGQKKITHYTAIYMNEWNEVFCSTSFIDQGFISMAHVKKDLMFKLRMRKLPLKTVFYFSKGVVK